MQAKKKSLFYFFVLFLFMPCFFMLSACGEPDENGGNGNESQQISHISISYAGTTYNFDNSQGAVEIEYAENLNFQAQDFTIVIHYMNSTETTQISASGVEFSISKITYSQAGDRQTTLATQFDIGEYEIVAAYSGQSTFLQFSIVGIDISQSNALNVEYQQEQTYSPNAQNCWVGEPVCPQVAVSFGNTALVKDVDYTIDYVNNVEISTATQKASFTINGIGKYRGQRTYEFNINKVQLAQINPIQSNIVVAYAPDTDQFNLVSANLSALPAGFNQTKYIITKNNVVVYNDVAETPTFGSIEEAGVYQIEYVLQVDTEHFNYGFANPTATLTINSLDISNYLVNNEIALEYRGVAFASTDFPEALINLRPAENQSSLTSNDFSISMLENGAELGNDVVVENTNVSNATRTGAFKITGIGNYTGEITVRFAINPMQIIDADFNNLSNIYYDGTAKQPEPVVRAYSSYTSENIVLTKDTDYTLSYPEDCINAGQKTITITGTGNFTGSRTVNYSILKAQITLAGYEFAHPTTVYNGQDQKDYLLAFNKDLPTQVEAVFTRHGSLSAQLAEEVDMLKNANTLYSCPGEYIYANFRIKAQYDDNYTLSFDSQKEFEDVVSIEPFVMGQSAEAFTHQTIDGFVGSREVSSQTVYYYTYSGNAYAPKVIICADLDGNYANGAEYVLSEGQDYVLEYCPVSSWDSCTAVNAGEYYVVVNYEIAQWNQNFCAYKAQNGASMDYGSSNRHLRFDIDKAQLAENQISWPQTYRMLWGSVAYLNSGLTIYAQNTTMDINNNDVYIHFELELTYRYEYGRWIDNNGQINIMFSSANYAAPNHLSTPIIVNPFTQIRLNNQVLTAEQLEAIGSQLKLGDKLELAFSEGYQIRYGNSTYDFGETIYDNPQSGFSRIIGVDKKNGNYVYETSCNITLYRIENNTSTAVTGKRFDINRNVFSELAVYTSTDDLDLNYLNQNTWQEDSWQVNSGSKLKMTLATSGYTFDYDLIDSEGVATTYSTKLTTKTWVNDGSFAQVVIRVYNAQNDLIMTLHYNFKITSAWNLSMNPSIEFVFDSNSYLISYSAVNDEANYVLHDNEIGFVIGYDGKYEVISKYISLMEKYGYLGAANATLAVSSTDSRDIPILREAAEYVLAQKEVDIEISSQIISKATILATIQKYYKEYSSAELNAMNEGQLLELLSAMRNRTIEIQSSDLQELYNLQRAIYRLYNKCDFITTLSNDNDAVAQSLSTLNTFKATLLSGENNLMTSLSNTYISSMLKIDSQVVLAKAYVAELKKALLNAIKSGDTALVTTLEQNIQMWEGNLEYIYSSMSYAINQVIEDLDALYSQLDALLIAFGFDQTTISSMYAYINSHNFDTWFNTNGYNDYNLNVWTGTGITACGEVQYTYVDEVEENVFKTYSFNRTPIAGTEYYNYIMFAYDGEVANFDNATPIAFYQYYEESGIITVMKGNYEMFIVNGAQLEKPMPVVGTIVYTYSMENMGMSAKVDFIEGGALNYYMFGAFVMTGTWTQQGNIIIAVVGDSPALFNIVEDELVYNENVVYTYSGDQGGGMTMSVEFYEGGLFNCSMNGAYYGTGTWVQNDNIITATLNDTPIQFEIINDELFMVGEP